MKSEEILKARSADLRNSLPAMQRAAMMARKIGMETNLGIVVVREGKLVRISADELRKLGEQNRT